MKSFEASKEFLLIEDIERERVKRKIKGCDDNIMLVKVSFAKGGDSLYISSQGKHEITCAKEAKLTNVFRSIRGGFSA